MFLLPMTNKSGGEGLRAGRVLLFLRMEARLDVLETKEGPASVQRLNCAEPGVKIVEVFESAGLTESTSDEVSNSEMKEDEGKVPELDESLHNEPFGYITGRVGVARGAYFAKPPKYPRQWVGQTIYVNFGSAFQKFFKEIRR